MRFSKKSRYIVLPLLAVILLLSPFGVLTKARAGLTYTIRVGETVNMSFYHSAGISATWYSDNNSVASVVSGTYSNVCTVMGMAPGEAVITCQIMYQDVIYGYGDSATVLKPVRDISIIRVLPADSSQDSTNGQQNGTQNNPDGATMPVGSGGKASDFDKIITKDPYVGEPTFYDGLMPAVKDGKLGFIDEHYKVVVPFIYDPMAYHVEEGMKFNQFTYGIARVQRYHEVPLTNGLYYDDVFIDTSGNELNLNIDYSGGGISCNGAWIDGNYLVVRFRFFVGYGINARVEYRVYDIKSGRVIATLSDWDSNAAAKYGYPGDYPKPAAGVWNPSELSQEELPQEPEYNYRVGSGTLKLRSSASTSSTILQTFRNGEKIGVLETKGAWTKVRNPSGLEGWVASANIGKSPYSGKVNGTVKVLSGTLKLRADRSTSSKVIQELKNGASLSLLDIKSSDAWVKVKTSGGAEGWVASANVGIR